MDIQDALRQHLLFRSLSAPQLEEACQDAKLISIGRNRYLFNQGDPAKEFFYLYKGQIKLVLLSPNGHEKILEIINPGEIFAESTLIFQATHYPVAAQAMRNAQLISINNANYRSVLRNSNDSCMALLGDMNRRLHYLIREVYALTLTDASCRVADYLLAQSNNKGSTFELDIPKIALASRLSVKPETLSRIIKQFSSNRLIDIDKTRIQVLDPSSLRTLTDSCTRL